MVTGSGVLPWKAESLAVVKWFRKTTPAADALFEPLFVQLMGFCECFPRSTYYYAAPALLSNLHPRVGQV